MEKECLHQWIKVHGEKMKLKKGEFIFKSNKKDYNIYYIEKGLVELVQDFSRIFELGTGEMIGEKSFIEKTKKPIDALITEDSIVYCISPEKFDTLVAKEQRKGLECIISVLSNRVYKLNAILNLLVGLDGSIINYSKDKDKDVLRSFINQLVDLEGFLILRYEEGSFMQIDGGMIFNSEIESFINDLIEKNINLKIGKNYLFIRAGDFLFVFQGKVKIDHYTLVNSIIYSQAILNYLGELMESEKNKNILDTNRLINE